MFRKIVVILIALSFFTFCKTKKKGTESTRPLTINEKNIAAIEKITGVVSQNYKNCGTVVVVKTGDTELILIPFPALDKAYDKEGLSIKFTYRKLRVPVPEGCLGGAMSELKDIEKSN